VLPTRERARVLSIWVTSLQPKADPAFVPVPPVTVDGSDIPVVSEAETDVVPAVPDVVPVVAAEPEPDARLLQVTSTH
jgi:hypothetical protein